MEQKHSGLGIASFISSIISGISLFLIFVVALVCKHQWRRGNRKSRTVHSQTARQLRHTNTHTTRRCTRPPTAPFVPHSAFVGG